MNDIFYVRSPLVDPSFPDGLVDPLDLRPPRRLSIRYQPSNTAIEQILAAVRRAGLSIADLSTEEGDLEDIFLALTAGRPSMA